MRLITTDVDPRDWRSRAACAGDMANAFYPPLRPERRSVKAAREQRAKAICDTCPVQRDCLEQAVERGERYGIWGGLTDVERSHFRAS